MSTSGGLTSKEQLPWLLSSVRGYKSMRRSMKPLNTAASWVAAEPFLPKPGPSSPPAPHAGGGRAQQQRQQQQQARDHYQRAPILDTCIPPIPRAPQPDVLKRIGVLTGEYRLRPEKVFAVVELAGTQFKVTTDDVLFVHRLPDVAVNDVLSLERVLLLGSRCQTVIGRPFVPNACVLATVEEHFRDGEVHVFKKHKRKRYRRYHTPQQELTTLRILQVRGIEPAPGDGLAMPNDLPISLLPDFAPGTQEGAASLQLGVPLQALLPPPVAQPLQP